MNGQEYKLTPSCGFFVKSGNDGIWNLPMCVEIKRPYDGERMKSVLNRVIAENAAVRCIVSGKNEDGIYTVRFAENVYAEPEVMEIKADSCEEAYEKAAEAAKEFSVEPIDIYSGIPLKLKCFIISENEFIMTAVIHHFAADAVGIAFIGGKIMSYYLNGDYSHTDYDAAQFSSYLRESEEFTSTEEYAQQVKYWEQEFDGFELPVTKGECLRKPLERDHCFTVSRPMAYEFARRNNSTIFNVVMLAVNLLYAELFDTADTAVGFVSSDRMDRRYMTASGNYTRMLGARLTFDRKITFREALRNLRKKTSYAIESSAAGDHIRPLPIYASYLEERQTRQLSGSSDINFIGITIPHPTEYIMMAIIEKQDDISIGITADGGMYSDEQIESMGKRLIQIIRDMILTPDRRMEDYLSASVFEKSNEEIIMI